MSAASDDREPAEQEVLRPSFAAAMAAALRGEPIDFSTWTREDEPTAVAVPSEPVAVPPVAMAVAALPDVEPTAVEPESEPGQVAPIAPVAEVVAVEFPEPVVPVPVVPVPVEVPVPVVPVPVVAAPVRARPRPGVAAPPAPRPRPGPVPAPAPATKPVAPANEDGSRPIRSHERVVLQSVDLALEKAPVPLRVLDVGCGSGELLEELVSRLQSAIALVGTDPNPRLVARAARTLGDFASVVVAGPESMPFPDATFDVIFAVSSFATWRDQDAGLREARRMLRYGGLLVLAAETTRFRRGSGDGPRTSAQYRAALEAAGLRFDSRHAVARLAASSSVQLFLSFR